MKHILLTIFLIHFLIASSLSNSDCYYIEQASIARQANDWEKAISHLENAQKKYPNNVYQEEIALKLGKLYFDIQKLEKAKGILLKIDIGKRQSINEFSICDNDKTTFFKENIYWNPISSLRSGRFFKYEIKYLTCTLLKEIEIQQKNYSKAIAYLDKMTNIHFLEEGCGNAIENEQAIYQLEKANVFLLLKDTTNTLQTLGQIAQYSTESWQMMYQIWRQSYSREELKELFLRKVPINSVVSQETNHHSTQFISFLNTPIRMEFYSFNSLENALKYLNHPLFRFINNDTRFMIQEYAKIVYLSNDKFVQDELIELFLTKYSKRTLKETVLERIKQLQIQQNEENEYFVFEEIPIFEYKIYLYEIANSADKLNNQIQNNPFIKKIIE